MRMERKKSIGNPFWSHYPLLLTSKDTLVLVVGRLFFQGENSEVHHMIVANLQLKKMAELLLNPSLGSIIRYVDQIYAAKVVCQLQLLILNI